MRKIQFLVVVSGIILLLSSCSSAAKKNNESAVTATPASEKPAQEKAVSKRPLAPLPSKVWVAKSDGSKSCGMAAGISPKAAAKELQKKGLKVHKFRKGNDGLMHTMQCGGSTGVTVELQIDFKDLAKAEEQGYQPLLPQPH